MAAAEPQRDSAFRLLVGPAFIVVVVLGLTTLAAFSPGILLIGYAGMALAALAVPYTLVALAFGVIGRLLIRPSAPAAGPKEFSEREVQNFERLSQRLSLVLAVALLVVLAVIGVLILSARPESGTPAPVLWLGGTVVAGAVLMIASNIPQLYRRRVIAIERHAVANRIGAWRLIVVSWIASPLMWIGYATAVVVGFIGVI